MKPFRKASPREKLLRRVKNEPDLLKALASGGRLHKDQLEADGLWAAYEELLKPLREQPPFASVRLATYRDYLVLLRLQNQELRRENKALGQDIAKLWHEKTEGVGAAFLKPLLPGLSDVERMAAEQANERTRQAFRAGKQRERAREDWEWLQRKRSRERDSAPDHCFSPNWFEPMPAFGNAKTFGYVQATGRHRKAVGQFLRDIGAQPNRPKGKGRGRPKDLYGFDTNMKVLDQWLGTWLPQEPNRVAVAVMETLVWSASQEFEPAQARLLRELLLRHWRRIAGGITDPALLDEAKFYVEALNSERVWDQLARQAKVHRRRAEEQAVKGPPPPHDFLSEMCARLG